MRSDHETYRCMDEGSMKDFIKFVTTINRNEGDNARLKFPQLVLIQSLNNEFEMAEGQSPSTSAKSGTMMTKFDGKTVKPSPVMATKYQSSTEKLMHMMGFSRLWTNNAILELA